MIRNTIDYCDDLSLLIDRKKRTQPNGLIIGSPGSGKTILAKQEIIDVFLKTDDDIIICDPEGEYFPLVREFNGQVIEISSDSSQHINPMDIELDSQEGDPIADKSEFIISLCELIIGGVGLEPTERSIIDKCVRSIYIQFSKNPIQENMPTLYDLYTELSNAGEAASRIAIALDLYVTGSHNVFNHTSNVDLTNRIICFDIKKLGTQLKKVGMFIVQEMVWNRVSANRSNKKSTRYYLEEIYCLFKEEATAKYIAQLWVNARTNNCIITAITQNLEDLFSSELKKSIVYNVGFIYLLNQRRENREILVEKLGLSENLIESVINIEFGRGIVICGDTVLPLDVRIQPDTKLYNLLISNSWNG